MTRRELSKQIKMRKKLINFLLLFLSPTNKFMVTLSQDLDNHIYKYQHHLSIKYRKNNRSYVPEKLIA